MPGSARHFAFWILEGVKQAIETRFLVAVPTSGASTDLIQNRHAQLAEILQPETT